MKVSQAVFEGPSFVVMLQRVLGPHETKGVVSKLTRKVFKDFMYSEFQVSVSSDRLVVRQYVQGVLGYAVE